MAYRICLPPAMSPLLTVAFMIGIILMLLMVLRIARSSKSKLGAADIEAMQFASARDVLQFMKERRIGYIAVESGARWEAKDLSQQGIVNLLRARYFELHGAEQKKYFSELSDNHVEQARALMAKRPASGLRGYREQLTKLMIYVKDRDCLSEIQAELAAIQPKVEEEQVRQALDNPPARVDDEHLALLENYLEANPRFTLARELEAEIQRVKALLKSR